LAGGVPDDGDVGDAGVDPGRHEVRLGHVLPVAQLGSLVSLCWSTIVVKGSSVDTLAMRVTVGGADMSCPDGGEGNQRPSSESRQI
jgi:hypothetical protein